ncbi:hypothetical protein O4328_44480 [Rhodococcus opacus]|uniref:Uncharacterized protein n=1 Tax=Rhodococcus opacus TaxID=37919 RepID=A0AAX3YV39_RHOOP|nr:hypothetical protein [Rhodococcus opacus]MCZ4590590.1 hypothetical protein [Rhodococcus opacus]WLF52102.1 hypothetical protein Q5707_42500 [Rhodococcus opacus]
MNQRFRQSRCAPRPGLNGPSRIAVPGDTLYITEYFGGTVVSLPVSGGTPTTAATGLNRPFGVAVQPGSPSPCSGSL